MAGIIRQVHVKEGDFVRKGDSLLSLVNETAQLNHTGNLDKKNSQVIFDIFKNLSEKYNQTLLIVTHDTELAAKHTTND